MSHHVIQIVPPSRPLLRIAKRILVGAGLVAVGYVGAQVAPSPAGSIFAASFRGITSTAQTAPEGSSPSPSRDAPGTGASQRDFDYFPDHYQNQAKEAAKPIDTF